MVGAAKCGLGGAAERTLTVRAAGRGLGRAGGQEVCAWALPSRLGRCACDSGFALKVRTLTVRFALTTIK
jgi:hypothetical protein